MKLVMLAAMAALGTSTIGRTIGKDGKPMVTHSTRKVMWILPR